MKFAANGAVAWGPIPGSGNVIPHAAAVDAAGDLVVSSSRNSGPDGVSTTKFNGGTGQALWGPFDADGPSGSAPADLVTDASGNVILVVKAGQTTITLKYAGATGLPLWGPVTHDGQPSSASIAGNGDVVVAATSSGGLSTIRYAQATGVPVWFKLDPAVATFGTSLTFVASNSRIFTAAPTAADSNCLVLERDGASGALVWGPTPFYGNANGQARINDLAAGSDGNPVVAGSMNTSDGTVAISVIKYDKSTGDVLWGPVSFPTTSLFVGFVPYRVLVDSANNVVVAGLHEVIKLNGATGSALWQAPITFVPHNLALDPSGNVFAIGSITGDTTAADFATVKISGATGSVLWGPVLFDGAGQNDFAVGVGADAAGDVIVTGSASAVMGTVAWATLKYSGASGGVLWGPVYQNVGGYSDTPYDLALDASGNAIVIGQANSDMATTKYSGASGAVLWGPRLVNGPNDAYDGAFRLAVGTDGDVAVTGSIVVYGLDSDWATIKYRGSDGATLWGPVTLGGAGNSSDVPNAIAIDAAGDVVVAGSIRDAQQLSVGTTVAYDGATGAVLWGPLWLGGMGKTEVNGLSVSGTNTVITGRVGPSAFTLGYTSGLGIHTTAADLPFGSCSKPYDFQLVAQNGTAPYSWTLVSGTLPPGIELSPGGALSGVPAGEGAYAFRVQAHDSAAGSVQRDFAIRVTAASNFIPIQATVGPACSLVLSVLDSYASYLWLPGGETTPTISVAPASDTTYGVVVTDGGACESRGSLTVAAAGSINPVCDAPTILSMTPLSGPASGGSPVVVAGAGFQAGLSARIGGVSMIGPNVTANQITATTPILLPGTLNDVLVINPDFGHATLPRAFVADFLDVPSSNSFHDDVVAIFRNGITAGCGGGNYCGTAPVSRAQMAVFLLKAEHGADFVPPSCTGLFDDVACPGGFAVDWIEQLSVEGITGGCGGANFCPTNPVRRDQMAVFLLKASEGSSYVPPTATGTVFTDVPASAFAADWIEDLYSRNVTGGCLTNPLRYCPGNTNNRQQMAVFITKTFGLQ